MRLSPWGRVVAISALLIVGGLLTLALAGLASPAKTSASNPPTIRRAEIATTRPHGDKRIAAHHTCGPGLKTRAAGVAQ